MNQPRSPVAQVSPHLSSPSSLLRLTHLAVLCCLGAMPWRFFTGRDQPESNRSDQSGDGPVQAREGESLPVNIGTSPDRHRRHHVNRRAVEHTTEGAYLALAITGKMKTDDASERLIDRYLSALALRKTGCCLPRLVCARAKSCKRFVDGLTLCTFCSSCRFRPQQQEQPYTTGSADQSFGT